MLTSGCCDSLKQQNLVGYCARVAEHLFADYFFTTFQVEWLVSEYDALI